jgi:hypothetical protein
VNNRFQAFALKNNSYCYSAERGDGDAAALLGGGGGRGAAARPKAAAAAAAAAAARGKDTDGFGLHFGEFGTAGSFNWMDGDVNASFTLGLMDSDYKSYVAGRTLNPKP